MLPVAATLSGVFSRPCRQAWATRQNHCQGSEHLLAQVVRVTMCLCLMATAGWIPRLWNPSQPCHWIDRGRIDKSGWPPPGSPGSWRWRPGERSYCGKKPFVTGSNWPAVAGGEPVTPIESKVMIRRSEAQQYSLLSQLTLTAPAQVNGRGGKVRKAPKPPLPLVPAQDSAPSRGTTSPRRCVACRC